MGYKPKFKLLLQQRVNKHPKKVTSSSIDKRRGHRQHLIYAGHCLALARHAPVWQIMCHDTATTYLDCQLLGQTKKIRPGLSRLSAANRWPMDLRWGRRRDMKKRLSIDSAGLVLFFFFSSPFSPLFPIRHLSVEKGRRPSTWGVQQLHVQN